MSYDNTNSEVAHLRDVYLEAERDYVKYLMQFDEIRKWIYSLNKEYKPNYLFQIAQDLIDRVESGEFSDAEMEKVEIKLIVLLAAIRDKVLLKELIKYPDYEDELDNGRSR